MTQLSFTIWSVQMDTSLLALNSEMNGTEASIILGLQRVAMNFCSCTRSRGGLAYYLYYRPRYHYPTHSLWTHDKIIVVQIFIRTIGQDQRRTLKYKLLYHDGTCKIPFIHIIIKNKHNNWTHGVQRLKSMSLFELSTGTVQTPVTSADWESFTLVDTQCFAGQNARAIAARTCRTALVADMWAACVSSVHYSMNKFLSRPAIHKGIEKALQRHCYWLLMVCVNVKTVSFFVRIVSLQSYCLYPGIVYLLTWRINKTIGNAGSRSFPVRCQSARCILTVSKIPKVYPRNKSAKFN